MSEESFANLRHEILERGFSFCIHIWQDNGINHILSGTQRWRVVKALVEDEGYECPPLPCNPVEASDIKEAALKLAAAASQYGKPSKQGLYEFAHKFDLVLDDLKHLELPGVDLDVFTKEYFEEELDELKPEPVEDALFGEMDDGVLRLEVPEELKKDMVFEIDRRKELLAEGTENELETMLWVWASIVNTLKDQNDKSIISKLGKKESV